MGAAAIQRYNGVTTRKGFRARRILDALKTRQILRGMRSILSGYCFVGGDVQAAFACGSTSHLPTLDLHRRVTDADLQSLADQGYTWVELEFYSPRWRRRCYPAVGLGELGFVACRPRHLHLVKAPALTIVPVSMRQAADFVAKHHRHHGAPKFHIDSIGVADETGVLRGVAMVNRPAARALDDGFTVEVSRLCTDGARNACSMLYAACARAAQVKGYKRIQTYTLLEEDGASLRAVGWRDEGPAGGGSWSSRSRQRVDKHPTGKKRRWARDL